MTLARASRLLVLLPLVLTACGLPSSEDPAPAGSVAQRIINGSPCTADDHPSAVALLIEANVNLAGYGFPIRTVLCTGTLIAPDVVLTAAHCLTPSLLAGGMPGVTVTGDKYYVTRTADLEALAAMDPTKLADLPGDATPARARVANPGFSEALLNQFTGGLSNLFDTGLLFLDQPLTGIEPAVVITRDEAPQLAQGTPLDIAGWGQQTAAAQNPFQPPPPGTIGIKVCAASFINELGDHEMQVGAGTETSRKCHGDSGGPSYMTVEATSSRKDRVVGITSHAYDQTDCAKGGADTRVDAWLDWIDQEMSKACQEKTRVWCDVEGVIPPGYYDPKLPEPAPDLALPEVGSAGGDGAPDPASDPSPKSGCSCTAAGRPAPLGPGLALFALPFGLAVLGLARRRARR